MVMSARTCGAIALALFAVTPALPAAEPLRIQSKIYIEGDAPSDESLTLFDGAEVFDYVDAIGEATIFQPAQKRFVILVTEEQLRVELRFDEIEALLERSRAAATRRVAEERRSGNPTIRERAQFVEFLLNPSFSRKLDPKTGMFEFSSVYLNYRVRTAPAGRPGLADRIREHSDWQCRLAGLLEPSRMPPYARLAVNEALAKNNLVQVEVGLEIMSSGRRIQLKAAHEMGSQLSDGDRQRLATARRQAQEFRLVPFAEYFKKQQPGQAAKSTTPADRRTR
jgi:hypothetical protein